MFHLPVYDTLDPCISQLITIRYKHTSKNKYLN